MQRLLDRSFEVIGVCRSDVPVKHERLSQWACDLSDLGALNQVFSSLGEVGKRLGGAVLCHGYGDFGSVEQFSDRRIEKLINTNLTSHIALCRRLVPILKSNGGGDLVFIGSESAIKPGRKGAVYCATKYGLRGFVQALRLDCASASVRVGLVNPGMVDTPFFHDLDFEPGSSVDNRLQPATVADAVLSMLTLPKGAVMDEINLSPLKTVIRNKPQ